MISGLYSPTIPLISTSLDLSATTDVWTFVVPFKCRVVRAAVQIANTIGAAGVVKFDKIPKSGGTRGDGDVASISLATTHDTGEFVYDDPSTDVSLEEGDLVVVEVTDAAAASDAGYAVLLVREIPEVAGNNTAMVATA